MKKNIKTIQALAMATLIALGITGCAMNSDDHEHTYSQEWKTDETNHWHQADCEHTDKVSAKGEHKFGKTETVEATCKADGSKTAKCEVCGYTKEEKIEKSTAHVWDEGKVEKAATCAEEGSKKYTCTICKTEKTEAIGKEPHKLTNVTTWTTDAESHWHEGTCSVCNNKATKDKAAHTWNNGVLNESELTKTYTCTICGATKIQNVVIKSFDDFFADLGNDVTKITANATATPGITKEGTVANVYGIVLTGSTYLENKHFPSSLLEADLTGVDTSKVTSMGYMFYDCSNLTSLDVSKFDTSKVTYMRWMFKHCSSLTSLDVSKFDTSNVTNMDGMFDYCSSLTSLDVTKFDTSNVTSMGFMFSDCNSLTSLDVTKFDTSKVTYMRYMFSNCSSLTSLDVTKFDTSNVTDMNDMFNHCSSLTSLDVTKFDTSKVTYMGYMFFYCSSLTSLDLSSFVTSNVTNWNKIFNYTGKANAPLVITVKQGNWTGSTDAVNDTDEYGSITNYEFNVIQ